MKKTISFFMALFLILGLFSGCSVKEISDDEEKNPENGNLENSAEPVTIDFSKNDSDMFTEKDSEAAYDTKKAVHIKLNKTTATANSDSVKISDSKITITEEATYILSGKLENGMLIIDAPDTAKLQIVFDGVEISNETSAALYILEADKVFLTLNPKSKNTLSCGEKFTSFDDNNIDGAVFSKQDLTLNGSGSLAISSPGGHGIVCKDDLVITGGEYTIDSASHGIDANDSVRIKNATLNIDAGKDAIHAENTDEAALGFIYMASGTVKAEAEGDGFSASSYLQISDGTIELLAGGGNENGEKESSDRFGAFMGGMRPGGKSAQNMNNSTASSKASSSMKGIKATNSLLISGGDIAIDSADDGIHSDASVFIRGGKMTIATGDDALHAEETLTVTAGEMEITTCYEGLEALNIDVQGGKIHLNARDDGLNAAGGVDQSGSTGGHDGMFGGGRPRGGMGGGMAAGSNGSIKISGGELDIISSGDGIDANGTLEISGGITKVTGPTQGDTATLDFDKSAIIKGGTFIGTGASGMAQTFSDSEQGVIAIGVGNQSANTKITIKDQSDRTVLEHTPALSFAVVIFSSPEIKSGDSYTIWVGSQSGEIKAD